MSSQALTTRNEDYSKWYNDLVLRADLADVVHRDQGQQCCRETGSGGNPTQQSTADPNSRTRDHKSDRKKQPAQPTQVVVLERTETTPGEKAMR